MKVYKDLFCKFLSDKTNVKYALPIARLLLRQRTKGEYIIIRGLGSFRQEELEDRLLEIFTFLAEKSIKNRTYDSSIIPTTISQIQAPNFYFSNECLNEEEIFRILYLIFSGIYYEDYVVNIDNVEESIRQSFREYLINEKLLIFDKKDSKTKVGIDTRKLLTEIGVKTSVKFVKGSKEFIFSFLILSAFVEWIRRKTIEIEKKQKIMKFLDLPYLLKELKISDDIQLVIFVLSKEKKKIYFIPKVKNIIIKWYGNYLTGEEDHISIAKFIFSNYISHKDYNKTSLSLLNKFLYYFLSGHVNGELLNKLINLKISYELRSKNNRVFGFPYRSAKNFFRYLSL